MSVQPITGAREAVATLPQMPSISEGRLSPEPLLSEPGVQVGRPPGGGTREGGQAAPPGTRTRASVLECTWCLQGTHTYHTSRATTPSHGSRKAPHARVRPCSSSPLRLLPTCSPWRPTRLQQRGYPLASSTEDPAGKGRGRLRRSCQELSPEKSLEGTEAQATRLSSQQACRPHDLLQGHKMLQGARSPTGRDRPAREERRLCLPGAAAESVLWPASSEDRRRSQEKEREGSGEGPGSLTQLARLDGRCEKGSTWKAKTHDREESPDVSLRAMASQGWF